MKKQFCKECNKDTWQNPLKREPRSEQSYRCVECGFPRRFGQKHSARIGGKIMHFAKP
jgi:RNase P subunit RPR2